MNVLRLTTLATTALLLAACSSAPSVRKEIDQPSAKPKPLPGPVVNEPPKEPIVRTLPGPALKETPLTVKPLPQVIPPAQAATTPPKPGIERAPGSEPQVPSEPATGPTPPAASAPMQLALASPTPTGGPAVLALSKRAEEEMRAGDLVSAAATLERALRIEPNNAGLWSRLAEVRLKQGDRIQAEQLALKSNGLPGADAALKARNEQIIARARGR